MRPRSRMSCAAVFLLCLLLVASSKVLAHSMYQSAVLLDYHLDTVGLEVQVPQSRLVQALHLPVGRTPLEEMQPEVNAYLLGSIKAASLAGETFRVTPVGTSAFKLIDGAPYVVARFLLTPPTGAGLDHLVLEDNVVLAALPGQVALVSIRSDWNSSTYANDPQFVGVLRSDSRSVVVDRSEGSWVHGFSSIFHLGVRHIAEGTDHLLFLLALLLPAPLLARNHRWGSFAGVHHSLTQILKVVTAFTIGHSVTLALGATGVVRVPEQPIEVLIAVSILVSALHALRPLFPGREAAIAGFFGLIHGLAFASTLGELGLTHWERAASILAFNLGIETMQLCVVAAVMPSLMLMSRTRVYPYFRVAGGTLAGAAACGWILNRLFGIAALTDRLVNAAAAQSGWIAFVLFLVALGSNRLPHRPWDKRKEPGAQELTAS